MFNTEYLVTKIIMSKILKAAAVLVTLLTCAFSAPDVAAAIKPQWIRQGEEAMNRKRINENYTFKVFHTWNPDLTLLRERRFDPLMTYVREQYGADPQSMKIDTIESVETDEVTYRISFKDASGDAVVYAKKVDEYCAFEDFQSNEYGFEYYQLYAVSDKNILPVFDNFIIRDNANSTAALLSIVPGVGQIYKGDTFKGCGILGTEILMAAGSVVSHIKYREYQDKADQGVPFADSWHSKATSCKVARNVMAGAFAGVWIYNILDAAVLPGGSRVIVKRPEGQKLTIAPSSTSAGVALTYRF